jgi:hypothetical protein
MPELFSFKWKTERLMTPMATSSYGVALFLALVFLAKWKRRRDAVIRLNRGLTSYVSEQNGFEGAPEPEPELASTSR